MKERGEGRGGKERNEGKERVEGKRKREVREERMMMLTRMMTLIMRMMVMLTRKMMMAMLVVMMDNAEVDSIEDGYHDSCITIECQLFLLGRQIDQDAYIGPRPAPLTFTSKRADRVHTESPDGTSVHVEVFTFINVFAQGDRA